MPTIKLVPRDECGECRGTGMAYPDCKLCEGNGWVDDPKDGGTMTCPECDCEECPFCEI